MSIQQFTNARVHEWLTPDLDSIVRAMCTTRVQLNSAALWWFLSRLTPQERAEILGEYVKCHAMSGAATAGLSSNGHSAEPSRRKAKAKRAS
jgi:hypothetical protein